MSCSRCGLDSQRTFSTEMNNHFSGREGLDIPSVLVFTEVAVCLDCGRAEFEVPVRELAALVPGSRNM